jgi:predicted transcriptional regulator
VPVRLDPELRDALQARANAENTTTSDVIRWALKDFLHVA